MNKKEQIRCEINKCLFPNQVKDQTELLEWDQSADKCATAIDNLYRDESKTGEAFKILKHHPEGFRIDYMPSNFLPKTRGVLMLHPDLIPEPPKQQKP